jgi:hypothetical protein
MTGYMMNQLAQGNPVLIRVGGLNHYFLVVGFDREGIWINDPSGACIIKLRGNERLDERHLNPVHLYWSEWFGDMDWKDGKPCRRTKIVGDDKIIIPTKNALVSDDAGNLSTLVILNEKASPTPALTMTVFSEDLQFLNARSAGHRVDFFNKFTWDVKDMTADGYYFAGPIYAEAGLAGRTLTNSARAEVFVVSPTNSDTLKQFTVTLSNSTPAPVRATVELLLAGHLLRTKKDVPLDPWTSNVQVDLMAGDPYPFLQYLLLPGATSFNCSSRSATSWWTAVPSSSPWARPDPRDYKPSAPATR